MKNHLKSAFIWKRLNFAGIDKLTTEIKTTLPRLGTKRLSFQFLFRIINGSIGKLKSFAGFTVSESFGLFQNYKQTVFSDSVNEYETRKLKILFQLNRFQLLLGFIMPFIVFFSEKNIAFLSALIFLFPPAANLLVLYLRSKHQNVEAMIAYFFVYPFFANLAYMDSFSMGAELFFVLYSILSVFFLHQFIHIIICVSFNTVCYLMLLLLFKPSSAGPVVNYSYFFLINHLVTVSVILYSLYLFKKENAGYQASIMENNNILVDMNNEVSRQKEEIAAKAKQLEDQAIRLKELDIFKSKLFSVVSHDLKGPLHALRNLFQEAETQKMAADEIKELVPDVLKDLNYATSLTDNLLNWAKSQMNAQSISPEDFNVSAMVSDVTKLLRLQAELKGIKIDCQYKKSLLAYADSEMIRLVVRNLLSNAIKFTPIGGVIFIDVHTAGNSIEVIIEDTGEGMDEKALEKIRNSDYFSTRGTADEQGTGLGLMLCKEFLAKNKGVLHIESTKGKGSIFSFTIPASDL